MKWVIKSWLTGKVLFATEAENFKCAVELAVKAGADLSYASLVGASLDYASLDYASLDYASLVGASLVGASLGHARLDYASLDYASLDHASLVGASLVGARLAGASLVGATGVDANRCTPLRLLLEQPGKIHAYKLVNEKRAGPYNGGIVYRRGKTYRVADANTDETEQCAAGINLATLDWCMREWQPGYRILVAEFTARDIAAIPTSTDGKFRVRRCKIVGEKDCVELGLAKPEPCPALSSICAPKEG